MKAFTDISQSRKLAEILPTESADMCYLSEESLFPKVIYNGMAFFDSKEEKLTNIIYCWSLAALMGILDRGALFKTPKGYAAQTYDEYKAITGNYHSNPVDACVEMIFKFHEQKLL